MGVHIRAEFTSYTPPNTRMHQLSDASTTNAAAGTPAYMAPELFRGERERDFVFWRLIFFRRLSLSAVRESAREGESAVGTPA